MADNVTVGNVSGQANDYIVSADEAASGQVQRVKLTLSLDGSDTPVSASELGLLVDLSRPARELLEGILLAARALTPDGGRLFSKQTDSVAAALSTGSIMEGRRELIPQFAFANVAASTTDGMIVPALVNHKIRVLAFRLHAGATATNLTFNSKPDPAAGAAVTEQFQIGANSGRADGFDPLGHFETVVSHGLAVTTGTGSTVGVGVKFIYV